MSSSRREKVVSCAPNPSKPLMSGGSTGDTVGKVERDLDGSRRPDYSLFLSLRHPNYFFTIRSSFLACDLQGPLASKRTVREPDCMPHASCSSHAWSQSPQRAHEVHVDTPISQMGALKLRDSLTEPRSQTTEATELGCKRPQISEIFLS